jgi:diguanylate cyclase (GGDEF)-like protein/PAS domain S-box-containing protein
MSDFFTQQQDYIGFLSGLAFVLVAVVSFALQHGLDPRLPWRVLGGFGVLHGLAVWAEVPALASTDPYAWAIARTALLALSFICLIEFGRGGLRATGRWAPHVLWYGPLFIIAAAGGMLGGGSGAPAAVRYGLGLAGGVLAGWALLAASRHATRPCRALRIAGVSVLLCGMAAGLDVPAGAFGLARTVNAPAFLATFGFPADVLLGSLALLVGLAIVYHAHVRHSAERSSTHRRLWRTYAAIAGVLLVAIVAAGWATTQALGDLGLRDAATRGNDVTRLVAESVQDDAREAAHAVAAMAGSPPLVAYLARPTPAGLSTAHAALDRYARSFDAAACYVLDPRGTVLASSNRAAPDSFMGKNYGFRPYFQQAMAGEDGLYMGVGVTSGRRGLYTARAIRDAAGRVLGVAAIKREGDPADADFMQHATVFVIDSHGVIFFGRDADVLKALWPMPVGVTARLVESRQFGAARAFPPILQHVVRDGDTVTLYGRAYLATRKPIAPDGWSVVTLTPVQGVRQARLFGILVTLVFCLLLFGAFGAWNLMSDTAARVEATARVHETLLEGSPNAVGLFDEHGQALMVNPVFREEVAWRMRDADILTLPAAWPEDARAVLDHAMEELRAGRRVVTEVVGDRPSGEGVVWLVALSPVRGDDGAPHRIVGIFTDITERKRVEEVIRHQAMHDALTGLANRKLFVAEVETAIARARRAERTVSVLYLDLDHFKAINDTLGHSAGDDLLRQVAKRLVQALRATDIVCRMGGDEFTILLPEIKSPRDAAVVAAKLVQAIDDPFVLGDEVVQISASVGVALYPEHGAKADTLIQVADSAMYEAKALGNGAYWISLV